MHNRISPHNFHCTPSFVVAVAVAVILVAAVITSAASTGSPQPAMSAQQVEPSRAGQSGGATVDQVERGRYIVLNVARCTDCHTPRDSMGNPNEARLLMGAPTPFLPTRPAHDWPTVCPRIGGTPPGTDEQIIKLLTTGVWKDGGRLRAPMPQFRMTREDAEAVLAFLKSLPAF